MIGANFCDMYKIAIIAVDKLTINKTLFFHLLEIYGGAQDPFLESMEFNSFQKKLVGINFLSQALGSQHSVKLKSLFSPTPSIFYNLFIFIVYLTSKSKLPTSERHEDQSRNCFVTHNLVRNLLTNHARIVGLNERGLLI